MLPGGLSGRNKFEMSYGETAAKTSGTSSDAKITTSLLDRLGGPRVDL